MIRRPARWLLAIGVALLALGGCTPLGALNTFMPADGGAEQVAEGVRYGEHERQRLDVYAPSENEAPAPVVVFIYGGSWDGGRRQDYEFVGRALASRGFVTVIPDYRLVPEVRYPAFVRDGAAVVEWARNNIDRYGGDTERLGVAGHSAGAYNAVMLGVAPRYVGAGADEPAFPVEAVAGLSGPYDFLPLDVAATKRAFAGVADLEATQPVNLVTEDGPPLFLATGASDGTVLPRNTKALARRARESGRDVIEKQYAGVGHAGLLLALGRGFRGRAPVLADLTAFFRRAL